MKGIIKTIAAVFLSAVFTYSFAQKPAVVLSDEAGWQKIGETTASFKKQNESIHVLGADEFEAIKLKVTDAPLSIERMQVFYASGEMEDIDVKSKIQQDGETKSFRLKNPDEDISKVAFTYSTSPNYQGEKANVQLFGLKSDDDKDNDRSDSENYRDEANAMKEDVNNAAERTGDELSEIGAKGKAEIMDQRHETKVGPAGQTIYIDGEGRYYYIDEEGEREYVSEARLKDKPGDLENE